MTSQQPRQWSDADTDELRRRHADGQSLRTIATEMRWAKQTISKRAIEHGLSFDRSRTAAATQARVIDAKAKRAELALALLEDADRLRAQLWAPSLVFNFGGRDNTYEEHTLDKPTYADQLKIMQALGAGIDRHIKLVQVDTDNSDTAAVDKWLGHMIGEPATTTSDTDGR